MACTGFPSKHERQRLGDLGVGMRRDRDLEFQRRRRGDLDDELGANNSFHSASVTGRRSLFIDASLFL